MEGCPGATFGVTPLKPMGGLKISPLEVDFWGAGEGRKIQKFKIVNLINNLLSAHPVLWLVPQSTSNYQKDRFLEHDLRCKDIRY
jgi:hypothetical protein